MNDAPPSRPRSRHPRTRLATGFILILKHTIAMRIPHSAFVVGLLLAAAAAVLAACAPPYIEALDQSASVVRKMTLVGTVGPIGVESDATNVRFLPPRPTASSIEAVSVQSGFLIFDASGSEQVSLVAGSSSGAGQDQSMTGAAAVAPFPYYQYNVVMAAAGQAGIFVDNLTTNSYQYYTASLGGGSLTLSTSGTLTSINGLGVVGMSVQPGSSTPPDVFEYLLTNAPFAASHNSFDGSTSTFGIAASGNITGGLSISAPILYYLSPFTSSSVASYYSAGQWVCLQWSGVGSVVPVTMTGVTHRIDAVLSTGDFLSAEGGTLRVFDPNGTGTEVATLDLRGLQYCYEAYVGATPYVFFALPMQVARGNWVFNVYAVPTSSMRSIGG